MKVVYIAGPYRAETEYQVAQNIAAAEALAVDVWQVGAAAICPHKNTSFMVEGDLDIVAKCDAVIVTGDWLKSHGARREVIHAQNLKIPVLKSIDELCEWLDAEESRRELAEVEK